ncbi:rhomboid family intramembrane serine protease [Aquabacterium sp.]|uniref:rhomboid family intramembrane serine protease n=1 Tax=Aquabacterium sp. TaxID=1872578 RepID=UPI0035B0DFE9
MPPLPPVTQGLILINVAIFCLQMISPSLTSFLALWPLGSHFLPWQVVSYAFLHGSLDHLFFNMLALWMFGAELEIVWGWRRYVQFYTACVLTAAAAQLLLDALMGLAAPTLGASGGVYGLLMAFGLMFPNRTIVPLIPPIPMKAITFVLIYGAIELFMGMAYWAGGVAHFAHLGGMLGGWLMMRYWRGQPPFGRR